MNSYSPEKMVEAFKMLQCEVYIGKRRIKVEFPEDISDFYERELKLAFKKANHSLYKYLFKQVGYKLKNIGDDEVIRIL